MGLAPKKVLLITSGQPSLNPRLVKEADALTEAGYHVIVLYQYWNEWGTELDKALLSGKKWKAHLIGGSPSTQKFTYFKSRLLHKIATSLIKRLGLNNRTAEQAIGRCTPLLIKKASSIPAAIYIAHNLAALPAAVLAAQKHKAKCGFDAEDFHRNEQCDDLKNLNVQLKKHIEDKYIPHLDYLSTASPLISLSYKELYPNHKPITILNVFPKQYIVKESKSINEKLKLFWFSQTIGIDRGLEIVIEAIAMLQHLDIELHLLGNHDTNIIRHFTQLAKKQGKKENFIFYHPPIPPDEIFKLASRFDIGLATEIGTPRNRDICLTNKLFTYIQSGLAIIATDTKAQKAFFGNFPTLGYLFDKNNAKQLSEIIKMYAFNLSLLNEHQDYALHLGHNRLNWENESKILLETINNLISNNQVSL